MQTVSRKEHRVLSEINVTPFVDIMLVLLVIFMVTAPMMQQGLDIELPKTSSAGISVPDKPLILLIRKNKEMFIGKTEIALSGLGKKVKAILKARKDKQVYIQADRRVDYETVARALASLRKSGVYQVSLITSFKDDLSGRKR